MRVGTFLVFLQLLYGNRGGLAAKDNENSQNIDALTIVKADNKPIESLDALRTGVFFVELSQGVRPGCGGSNTDQGMYEPLFILICILVFIVYMYLS
jgi:hypothetical protein